MNLASIVSESKVSKINTVSNQMLIAPPSPQRTLKEHLGKQRDQIRKGLKVSSYEVCMASRAGGLLNLG